MFFFFFFSQPSLIHGISFLTPFCPSNLILSYIPQYWEGGEKSFPESASFFFSCVLNLCKKGFLIFFPVLEMENSRSGGGRWFILLGQFLLFFFFFFFFFFFLIWILVTEGIDFLLDF